MSKSLAEQLAELPPEDRAAVLAELDPESLQWDADFWLRPEQIPPRNDEWGIFLALAGRGWGKSRAASEWLREKAKITKYGQLRMAIVTRIAADARDVMTEGTALALDTEVATPEGFTPIGDIKVGDYVMGADGKPTLVTWCSPVSNDRPCYRIEFSNGEVFTADAEHKWLTTFVSPLRDGSRPKKVRTTLELANLTLKDKRSGQRRYWVDRAQALRLPNADLVVPPYTLGYWLGDGTSKAGEITTMDADEVLAGIRADGFEPRPHGFNGARHGNLKLGDEETLQIIEALKVPYQGQIRDLAEKYRVHPQTIGNIKHGRRKPKKFRHSRTHEKALVYGVPKLRGGLLALGVVRNKHIPSEYLRASYDQRMALLRGLMDSDGGVSARGQAEFSNVNKQLAYDVLDLCATLGIKASMTFKPANPGKNTQATYRVRFECQGLEVATVDRKKARTSKGKGALRNERIYIESVTETKSVPVRCISVDNEDHLFLIGRKLVPTHNSGILEVSPPSERPEYQPSKRKLTWPNGNTALLFSSEEPALLRGPQFHYAVADEFAAWRQIPDEVGMTAWDNLRIATRLGDNPQVFIATTPKKVQNLKDLLKEASENPKKIVVRKGSTMDNASNLAESYIDGIFGVYEGTKLGRQELYGDMLDDIEGALFSQNNIDQFRASTVPIGTPLKIVGVDPTVAEKPGDECGIVVMASSADRDLYKRQAWVLEDATVHGSPDVWAKRVVDTARKWGAPVVAEKNQGGAMIRNAIQAIDPTIPVFEVWSKQGKALRAEPIALVYEQGRIHHLGYFAELEDQMVTWEPEVARKSKSPDRLDALVLAATALMILPPKGFGGGVLKATSPARHKLPQTRASSARGSGRRAAVYGVDLRRRR